MSLQFLNFNFGVHLHRLTPPAVLPGLRSILWNETSNGEEIAEEPKSS